MTAKEERIREEWIKAIGYFSDDLCKETGYISGNSNSVYNYFEDFCLNKEDFDFKSENYGSLIRWRPKSLQGIENNNGWIKIESEDDLPKAGEYDMSSFKVLYWTNGGLYHSEDYKRWKLHYSHLEVTHYQLQPIKKPKPPIY